jgi:flagellar biosynthesis protein FlhB
MSDKAFAPTPSRLARARREGQVPRSPESAAAAAFGAGLTGALFGAPHAFGAAARAIEVAARGRPEPPAAIAVLAWALLPAACAAAGALAASFADGGLHVRVPAPDASRLDPAAGLRRMFSRDALLAAARAAAAFAVALAVLTTLAREAFTGALAGSSPRALAAFSSALATRASLAVLAVGAVAALFDRWSAHRTWLEGLRMTYDELKRDAREAEGDPHARGRRVSLHRALVRGSIARVREASFVVANPEHIAIALKYEPPGVPVPEILVRACDAAALRVKEIAREHGIPIVEDVALARALFAGGDAGDPIPRALYVAVAQIVAALAREGVLG